VARPTKAIKRDRQMNFSLTADELATLLGRANRAGMRPVDYGRWRLLGGEDQPVIPEKTVSTTDHMIYAQLRKLGNLLNQLVRHCHTTKCAPPAALEPLLEDIRVIISQESAP